MTQRDGSDSGISSEKEAAMTNVTDEELDLATRNLHACAYNAFVNHGSERGIRKLGDLGRAINYYERVKGRHDLEFLQRKGVIESFEPCGPECVVKPGGLFHAGGCPNDFNSDASAQRRKATIDQLPQKHQWKASPTLVGGPTPGAR